MYCVCVCVRVCMWVFVRVCVYVRVSMCHILPQQFTFKDVATQVRIMKKNFVKIQEITISSKKSFSTCLNMQVEVTGSITQVLRPPILADIGKRW